MSMTEIVKLFGERDYTDKTPASVEFSAEWINNFLGTDISEADMTEYLNRLEFKVENGMVIAPSFRIDIVKKRRNRIATCL